MLSPQLAPVELWGGRRSRGLLPVSAPYAASAVLNSSLSERHRESLQPSPAPGQCSGHRRCLFFLLRHCKRKQKVKEHILQAWLRGQSIGKPPENWRSHQWCPSLSQLSSTGPKPFCLAKQENPIARLHGLLLLSPSLLRDLGPPSPKLLAEQVPMEGWPSPAPHRLYLQCTVIGWLPDCCCCFCTAAMMLIIPFPSPGIPTSGQPWKWNCRICRLLFSWWERTG